MIQADPRGLRTVRNPPRSDNGVPRQPFTIKPQPGRRPPPTRIRSDSSDCRRPDAAFGIAATALFGDKQTSTSAIMSNALNPVRDTGQIRRPPPFDRAPSTLRWNPPPASREWTRDHRRHDHHRHHPPRRPHRRRHHHPPADAQPRETPRGRGGARRLAVGRDRRHHGRDRGRTDADRLRPRERQRTGVRGRRRSGGDRRPRRRGTARLPREGCRRLPANRDPGLPHRRRHQRCRARWWSRDRDALRRARGNRGRHR